MIDISIFLIVLLITFLSMEGVTWLTHRYVMHGFLWYLHEDHHNPRKRFLEKNDLFFVIFAVPSILLFYLGSQTHNPIYWGLGSGIFCYGMAYFLVHDIIIHQRFKWFSKSQSLYIRALRWAHMMHHKHLKSSPGESFGMLFVAKKYWDKVRRDTLKSETAPLHK